MSTLIYVYMREHLTDIYMLDSNHDSKPWHAHTHIHTYTRAHTQTRACAHRCTHKHRHTHTHKQPYFTLRNFSNSQEELKSNITKDIYFFTLFLHSLVLSWESRIFLLRFLLHLCWPVQLVSEWECMRWEAVAPTHSFSRRTLDPGDG